jgi:hypothetical protein
MKAVPREDGRDPDTALGDWYVNLVVVDRRPLLLMASSRSLLPLIEPLRDLRSLAGRLPDLVGERLRRLGIDRALIRAEVAAMDPVLVNRTLSRSVLGILNDYARCLPDHLPPGEWNRRQLNRVEERLQSTPCFATRPQDLVFPDRKTPELLWRRGLAEPPAGTRSSR